MWPEKKTCVFISYAFSNEKNTETDTVNKEFLQWYIGGIVEVLKAKWIVAWHSLIPEEDAIISKLPYDDAIRYCTDAMTLLHENHALTILSVLKYPWTYTHHDMVEALPSTWMKREFAHAQQLGIPRIVAAQAWLETHEGLIPYFTDTDASFVSFIDLTDLFEQVDRLW